MNEELERPKDIPPEQEEQGTSTPDIVEGTVVTPSETPTGAAEASAAPEGETGTAEAPEEASRATESSSPEAPNMSSPLTPAPIDENDRVWAMLAYVGQIILPLIPPIIILMIEPNRNRPFQRYHALHALAFGIVAALYEAFMVSLILFFFGTGILLCLGILLLPALALPYLLGIWYGIQAYRGEYFEIPGITTFLRQQRLLD